MMHPDFAGKLWADGAADAESEEADTGFEFGAATDSASPDSASAESAVGFDFGGGPRGSRAPPGPQGPSPAAERPGSPTQPEPDFESGAEEVAKDEKGRGSAFRTPGDAATLPELIRFLIDRTGYIKALETEGRSEEHTSELQ